MAVLGLKEMGKFLWEGREKKSSIMKSGLDAMPLFLLDDLLKSLVIDKSKDKFASSECHFEKLFGSFSEKNG